MQISEDVVHLNILLDLQNSSSHSASENKYVICAIKCRQKLNYGIVCAVCINKYECNVLDPYSNLILIMS